MGESSDADGAMSGDGNGLGSDSDLGLLAELGGQGRR